LIVTTLDSLLDFETNAKAVLRKAWSVPLPAICCSKIFDNRALGRAIALESAFQINKPQAKYVELIRFLRFLTPTLYLWFVKNDLRY